MDPDPLGYDLLPIPPLVCGMTLYVPRGLQLVSNDRSTAVIRSLRSTSRVATDLMIKLPTPTNETGISGFVVRIIDRETLVIDYDCQCDYEMESYYYKTHGRICQGVGRVVKLINPGPSFKLLHSLVLDYWVQVIEIDDRVDLIIYHQGHYYRLSQFN